MNELLSDLEKELVAGAIAGNLVDRWSSDDSRHLEMSKWGKERTVRAGVIRELLRGRHPESGDAIDVDPRGVQLRGCVVEGRLDLERVATDVDLRLWGCYIPHSIEARHAQLQGLDLEGSTVYGWDESGAVRLQGANVRTWVSFSGSTVTNGKGPAIMADGLTVGDSVFLNEKFKAGGQYSSGLIRLAGAQIGGNLDCTGARITNTIGPAIVADNLKLGSSLLLDSDYKRRQRLEVHGCGSDGAVRLAKAQLGGHLSGRHALICNDSGPAISADGLVADGGAVFDHLVANGEGENGTFCMAHAKINSQLRFPEASLVNPSGPALDAEGLWVSGDVTLGNGAQYQGDNDRGAINLRGAHIEGDLFCIEVTITNQFGPALAADRIKVTGDLGLEGTTRIRGRGDGVLHLQGVAVAGRLFYGEPVEGRSDDGAEIGPWAVVDGLTYRDVPSCGLPAWLRLLQDDSGPYRPQPYQQLAAAARANGHVSESRQVLIAQRNAQRRSENISRWRAAWLWFLEHSVGYGYRPLRVVIGLATSVLIALLLALGPLAGALMPTSASGGTDATCSAFQRAGTALNATLPLVKVGWAEGCVAGADWRGSTWNLLSLGLGAVSWICATLFVAGFTRLVRDP